MNNLKYALFAGLGVATLLLLTTDRGKKIRENVADKAKDNAQRWKERLTRMGAGAADRLDELKDLLSTEVEGLGDDARARIEKIVNGTTKTLKKAATNNMHI